LVRPPWRSCRWHPSGAAQLGQQLVRLRLLSQCLIEELDRVLVDELQGPSLHGAVAGHLIVLDGLRRGEQAGGEGGAVLLVLDDCTLP